MCVELVSGLSSSVCSHMQRTSAENVKIHFHKQLQLRLDLMAPLQEVVGKQRRLNLLQKEGINEITLSVITPFFKEHRKNKGRLREGFYRNIDSDSLI